MVNRIAEDPVRPATGYPKEPIAGRHSPDESPAPPSRLDTTTRAALADRNVLPPLPSVSPDRARRRAGYSVRPEGVEYTHKSLTAVVASQTARGGVRARGRTREKKNVGEKKRGETMHAKRRGRDAKDRRTRKNNQ